MTFLGHRGDGVTHLSDNAQQIVGGYAKPFFQTSCLAGVGQINLISNRMRLGSVHLDVSFDTG